MEIPSGKVLTIPPVANLGFVLVTMQAKGLVRRRCAVKLVSEEVKKYKGQLRNNNVQYKILSEETQADGSVMIEIMKQYNSSPTGHDLD